MLSQFISFFTDSLESGCTQLCSLTINHQHIIKEHHWVNLFTQYDWDQIAVSSGYAKKCFSWTLH